MEITMTASDDQNATTWHSLTQIATKNLSANCASGYHMTETKVSRHVHHQASTKSKTTVALLMAAVLIMYPSVQAFAEQSTIYSGRAIGLLVDTAIADLSIADTGELPPQGGVRDATVLDVNHQLVHASVLLSVTTGFDNIAESEAATAKVTLLPGSPNQITADFVRANSIATCNEARGSSEIVGLRVGQTQVDVSGEPNETYVVPGVLTLIINEQINSSHDNTNEITVNALHLTLATGEQVIVSSAYSDISCGQPEPTPKDFVTGGGFINTENGKANFGFVAGFKPGKDTLSGNLNYVDHAEGIHLKSVSVTSYGGEGNTRTFSGEATINGQNGFTYTVTVSDNGEPGKGVDTFKIELSNGYQASGVLAGGNIQLHS
jgi:hypothetical protein